MTQHWPRRDTFPRISSGASLRCLSPSRRRPASDRADPGRGGRIAAAAPFLLLLLLTALLPTPTASADEILLVGGGRIVADLWWKEGDTLFYETDAGTVGIPLDQVVEIREGTERAPRYRGAGDAPAPPTGSEAGGTADGAARPPAARPTPEQLDAAIEATRTSLRREGRDEMRARLGARLADLLVLRARTRVASGRPDDASADYETALYHVPAHRFATLELGWLHLGRGEPRRARELAAAGLAAHPGDGWLLELRADADYRENRLRDALESLAGALKARPDDAALRAKLDKVRRDIAAEHDYSRTLSRSFVLRYDGETDDDLGREILDAMEEDRDELTRQLEVYPLEPVTVILYTRETFHETTGTGREIGGLFDGKIRLPVGGLEGVTPAMRRLMRHELAHALLHVKGAGAVPRWLHEGLAQRLEPRDPALARPALARDSAADPGFGLEPFSYPKALSFVGFLEREHGFARILWFIDLLAERRPETDALREAFGASDGVLIETWRESLQNGR